VVVTYSVVIVSWAAFGFFVVIKETLLRRSNLVQSIEQSVCFSYRLHVEVADLIEQSY
jgi:hypothetical protein